MTETWQRHRALVTWLGLVVLTLASSLLGRGAFGTGGPVAAAVVLVLGFVKARFVLTEFMELHRAPRVLLRLFDAWVVGVGGLLVVLLLTWSEA